MLIVTVGGLLASGLFCLWISLQCLSELDQEGLKRPEPQPPADEPEEEKPKLTRLGRPIEEVRLQT